MSENNVYNLRNLIDGGYVGKINLIVSDYFFSNEKWKLIKLIEKEVKNIKIFSVRTHTKITIFEVDGKKISITGSANMRTNGNYEQISIDVSSDIYDFYYDTHKQMTKGFGMKAREDKGKVEYINIDDYGF